MAINAGKFQVSGFDTAASGTKYPVHKLKIMFAAGGKVKGKIYYVEQGNWPAQKCLITGTWTGLTFQYSFTGKWKSGATTTYNYKGSASGDTLKGSYEAVGATNKGTFEYKLEKVIKYKDGSDVE
eukprot:TRINITY_DN637_c0_g2_i5.p1 TRINITY_DN637_c0_g2~~TRINITY_DN637_c0_g2_i5.p1  ORF type:complete len:125 (-),score=52.39 TRINITY_DN637_c0_g2_i5:147-521(-)